MQTYILEVVISHHYHSFGILIIKGSALPRLWEKYIHHIYYLFVQQIFIQLVGLFKGQWLEKPNKKAVGDWSILKEAKQNV